MVATLFIAWIVGILFATLILSVVAAAISLTTASPTVQTNAAIGLALIGVPA